MWPWGAPSTVRDKIVNRAQVEKKGLRKKGDPKNPALASSALLDSIAPAHSAEELRLPMPVLPGGHDADVESFLDRPFLSNVAERLSDEQQSALDRGLGALKAPPERVDRLKSLLQREQQMLQLVGNVSGDIVEIERRRREEQSGELA
jgi:3',5'-cyclic AMP phosphodiesterase CpdA